MHNMYFERELEVACDLARRAGHAALEHYHTDFKVDFKDRGETDPITQADRDANALIVQGLKAAFPGDGILAEESALDPTRHQNARLWCIDPIDGTREFVDRNGQFAVMIGLAVDGRARAGVVYQPTEDRLLWGSGDRAFINQHGETRPLRVTQTRDPGAAVMMVSRSHLSSSVTQIAAALKVSRQERLGSVGLKVGRIAEGAADLYVSASDQTKEWDACGPEAIICAAGGRMSDFLGRPLLYNKSTPNTPRGMIASNGVLHDAAVAAAASIARKKGWI